jgi:hypothetical protein
VVAAGARHASARAAPSLLEARGLRATTKPAIYRKTIDQGQAHASGQYPMLGCRGQEAAAARVRPPRRRRPPGLALDSKNYLYLSEVTGNLAVGRGPLPRIPGRVRILTVRADARPRFCAVAPGSRLLSRAAAVAQPAPDPRSRTQPFCARGACTRSAGLPGAKCRAQRDLERCNPRC